MTNVLVTYGWCRTAYVAAESLARARFRVYACDASLVSMTRVSRFVCGYDRTPNPFQEPQAYVESLARIVSRRGIDVLLPAHEDALAIQLYRQLLPERLVVACPSLEDLTRTMDKYEIVCIARAAGVPAPVTIAPKGIDEFDQVLETFTFPLLIKTRRGNSGKGVFLARSRDEAKTIYRDIVQRFALPTSQLPIVQEYINGGQLLGSCFLAQNGQIKACFLERYLRCKGDGFGTSVLREPYEFPLLREYTERLVRALNWTGIGQLDFIVDRGGAQTYLLEMNPRLWGALYLAVRNGYDFPRGLVTMLLSGQPDRACFQPSTHPVKSLWIVGELIAGLSEFRRGKRLALLTSLGRILAPTSRCIYDDFRWHDPLPLLAEIAYYGTHFVLAGGDTNPTLVEMMR